MNTTKLIAAGSLGALMWILTLPGALINVITPVWSGGLNPLIYSVFAILCLFITNKFGYATLMFFVFGILAIPFPLLGVPGLITKIVVAIIAGLIADVTYVILKKNQLLTALIAPGLVLYWFAVSFFILIQFIDLPGMDQVLNRGLLAPLIIFGSLGVGAVAGLVGYAIYSKVKDSAVVKRIQNETEHMD